MGGQILATGETAFDLDVVNFILGIKQLQTKLARTAATEMKLLTVFDRRVKSVISVAEASGISSTYQGKDVFVVKFKISRC